MKVYNTYHSAFTLNIFYVHQYAVYTLEYKLFHTQVVSDKSNNPDGLQLVFYRDLPFYQN